MCVVSYLCKRWIASAPFLGARTGCLTSELENVSCCLLVPAGINEKYHCALTEAQPSRRSGGVCVLTLLFEKAARVFPKPQNQLDVCLGPICLGQEAGGDHVPLLLWEGSVWVFAAALTGILLPYLGRANRCLLEKPSLHFIFYKTLIARYVSFIICHCPGVMVQNSIALCVVPPSLLNGMWQHFLMVQQEPWLQ